jgi:hypothetical protein
MADLFTRLVSGPVTPISPQLSIADESPAPAEIFEDHIVPSSPSPASYWVPNETPPHQQLAPMQAAQAPLRPEPRPSAPVAVQAEPPASVTPAPVIERSERETVTTNVVRETPIIPASNVDIPSARERVRPVEPPELPEPRRAPRQRQAVQITIGRIEIRAPQPPAAIAPAPVSEPAPPSQPRAEGLSLADYLRGNDGRPR